MSRRHFVARGAAVGAFAGLALDDVGDVADLLASGPSVEAWPTGSLPAASPIT